MKLDSRHLAQLSVIVEAGSFQSAADRLGLTQPALSRNMRTLEQRVGSTLFQRDGRRSVPNTLGQQLSRSGLAIRLAEEQAEIAADKSLSGALGELRIGAPPIVAGRFLTNALSRFIKEYPNCSVELKTGLVHELRSMLERGQIDLVLGPQSLAHPNDALRFEHLIDDRVGILCRSGHELSTFKKITPSDLEAHFWLTHSRGSLLRQQTEAAMLASGITSIQVAVETDSIRSALEIISNTDLVTTMPIETTTPYLQNELIFLDFDSPHFHRPIGVIRRKDTPESHLEQKFFSCLVSAIL
ncbi:MAG: LysR family transcriptional regulator [Granulosicoccus sp.]